MENQFNILFNLERVIIFASFLIIFILSSYVIIKMKKFADRYVNLEVTKKTEILLNLYLIILSILLVAIILLSFLESNFAELFKIVLIIVFVQYILLEMIYLDKNRSKLITTILDFKIYLVVIFFMNFLLNLKLIIPNYFAFFGSLIYISLVILNLQMKTIWLERQLLLLINFNFLNLLASDLGLKLNLILQLFSLILNLALPKLLMLLNLDKHEFFDLKISGLSTIKSTSNFFFSEILWYQLQVRRVFIFLNSNIIYNIIYFNIIIIISTLLLITGNYYSSFVFSYVAVINDLTSRATTMILLSNPNMIIRAENNLPQIQKRSMHSAVKAAQYAAEYTAAHPAQVATGFTTLAGGVYAIYKGEAFLSAAEDQTAATEKQTAVAERQTAVTQEHNRENNSKWAADKMLSGEIISPELKQTLTEVTKTGFIDSEELSKSLKKEIEIRENDPKSTGNSGKEKSSSWGFW